MGRVNASAEEARGGQRTRAVRECGPVCRRGHVGVAKPGPQRAVPTCCLSCVSLHAGGKGRKALGTAVGLLQQEGTCIEGNMHPRCRVFTGACTAGGRACRCSCSEALASEMDQTVIARLTGRLKEAGDVAIGGGCRDRHSCAMR